ncbi:MAG: hypothetical protein QM608_17295, partial [Caulobacter sp.]
MAIWDRIRRSFSVSLEGPELLQARREALARFIPLMYAMLVANIWLLVLSFHASAPVWLTLPAPMLLSVVCGARLLLWRRRRNTAHSPETAAQELSRINLFAMLLGMAIVVWTCALLPYGDAYAQCHVAFFMGVSMLGVMSCLTHLRTASLMVNLLAGVVFLIFFGLTGKTEFMAMTANLLFVSVSMVVIVLFRDRDFVRMINAQTEARRREEAQSRLLRMIDDMPVAVMTVEPETLKINYANETSKRLIQNIEHLLPIKAEDLQGTSIDVFHRRPDHQRRILNDPANLPYGTRIHLGPEVLDLKVSAVMGDDGAYLGPMLTWALVTKEV